MRVILTALLVLLSVNVSAQKLVILHLNDTHSHIEPQRMGEAEGLGGVIEVAAYIDSVRAAAGEDNVLLLHAGDHGQGTSYFSTFGGDLEINILNAMKFDAVALGNHEFDNGIEELSRRLANLKSQVLCANYDFSPFEVGKFIKPYAIFNKGGKKIGVFGMLVDITTVVDRSVADRVPKYDDVQTANKWAEYLKNSEGCDIVVMLSHMGIELDTELLKSAKNIDLVIGGHSHTFLEEPVMVTDLDSRQVPVFQAGCWGLEVGTIYL